jgi:hypothetical protein
MNAKDILSGQFVAGWLLILSSISFLPAGFLYTGRAIFKWSSAQSRAYLYWERGLVMAAILIATLGFVLLTQLLVVAGDRIVSLLAMTIFLIGTSLALAAEAFGLKLQDYLYAPLVVFVVLAFLGQAAFGVSLLRSGLLPGWVGWVTIIWNLAWLVILPITRPQDMYYPWLHYVAPLIIGIALLTRG